MKTVIIAVGAVVVMAGFLIVKDGGIKYVREQVEVIKEVEAPKEEWMMDEDAVKAAQDVIRKKDLEKELSALKSDFASSTEKYESEKKTFNEKKTKLEKELGTF